MLQSNLKLDKKKKALALNDCIKIINQASWDLKVITTQYPVNKIDNEDDYGVYIDAISDQVVNFSQAIARMALILES